MDKETLSMASASAPLPDGVPQANNFVDQDDATEVVSNVTHSFAAIRDAKTSAATSSSSYSGAIEPLPGLFANLRKFFNPRATDINQLLTKLQTQFKLLEVEHKKYMLLRTRSRWDEPSHNATTGSGILNEDAIMKDPKHPMNNPKLISEVHFVGRKATDSSIIELATLLMNNDTYGSITELWLNNNLISDDGASAIASYLQSPTCALIELWLGDNQIGPVGTALISAALESNTKLKCFGLYNNPIGNGGAMTLAQMLRKNHRLTTVDVHGCGRRGSSSDVIEGYGCKVIKARDGTEYIARVVAPKEDKGLVTDQRLLDAIQTYAAFNRINPTREQVVRSFTDSKKPGSHDDVTTSEGNDSGEGKKHTIVSKFLSELGSRPANETLTDAEKQTWKDCEWDRLYVEIERARAAKVALATEIKADIINEREGLLVNYGGVGEKNDDESHRLDDEVVYTDSRSWRNVKMSITGTAEPTHRQSSDAPADSSTMDVESESLTISCDSVDEVDS